MALPNESAPAIIFCDRVGFRVFLRALRLRALSWRSGTPGPQVLRLDADASLRGRATERALRFIGLDCREVQFFAGELRNSQGESVSHASRRMAGDRALCAARQLVNETPVLAGINREWGRNTFILHVARHMWPPLERKLVRVLVARVLAEEAGGVAELMLRRHARIPDSSVALADARFRVRSYGFVLPQTAFMVVVFTFVSVKLAAIARRVVGRLGGRRSGAIAGTGVAALDPDRPGLLLLQEWDLSMDRSYQTQPHWLFREDGRPAFNTYILAKTPPPADQLHELREEGVSVLPRDAGKRLRRRGSGPNKLDTRLRRDARRCLAGALFYSRAPHASASCAGFLLLTRACELASVCRSMRIRAFMTGESWMVEADAMQLVAPDLGIDTLTLQYSNLMMRSPPMMSTADQLIAFSIDYAPLWTGEQIAPRKIVPNGYIFDSSFELLRDRAAANRRALEEAGAKFIICYFDESNQDDKYGVCSIADQIQELKLLLTSLLADPTLGLVVKTQFERSSPSQLISGDSNLIEAMQTGRYLEMRRGTHRNNVLPAEAALSSDIAIGNIVGATASLEAALAGVRSLLVNRHGGRSAREALQAQDGIVFASMEEALDAIRLYRSGDNSMEDLGNWTPVLDRFDPFRDRKAGRRLRRMLDRLLMQPRTKTQQPGTAGP